MNSEMPVNLKKATEIYSSELKNYPVAMRLQILVALVVSELAPEDLPTQETLLTDVISGILFTVNKANLIRI